MNSTDRRIAILGAGPTGIEAALAAADAGLPFILYEAGDRVGSSLGAWGHVRLFSPWNLDISPRMRRHLESAGVHVPTGNACPTGDEVRTILERVAALPSIAPHIRLGHRVRAIGREGLLKHQAIGTPDRARSAFRILLSDPEGNEQIAHAGVVIDASGSYEHPNATGDGGIEAPGESSLGDAIVRQIPDLLGNPGGWVGRRTLLIGAGHSAKTAAVDLVRLLAANPEAGTQVTWALRRAEPTWETIENDALPARSDLIRRAQSIAQSPPPGFTVRCGVVVDRFAPAGAGNDDAVRVTLRKNDGETEALDVDRILSLTGFVGDHSLYRQLQVHECYATSGPMKLAAALLGSSSVDCMTQESHGAATLANPEPNFFILGSKSYGRNTTFLMRVGWQQVEEVFSTLAARAA